MKPSTLFLATLCILVLSPVCARTATIAAHGEAMARAAQGAREAVRTREDGAEAQREAARIVLETLNLALADAIPALEDIVEEEREPSVKASAAAPREEEYLVRGGFVMGKGVEPWTLNPGLRTILDEAHQALHTLSLPDAVVGELLFYLRRAGTSQSWQQVLETVTRPTSEKPGAHTRASCASLFVIKLQVTRFLANLSILELQPLTEDGDDKPAFHRLPVHYDGGGHLDTVEED